MCADCRNAVRQCLYCVHADRLAAEADAHNNPHGGVPEHSAPTIRSRPDVPVAARRNEVADRLWEQFMERHPGFTGALTEYHLSGFKNQ